MKKIVCLIVVAVLIIAVGGFVYHKTAETNSGSDVLSGEIIEISPDSVKGITQREAENLCFSVLGEKDEETGFTFSFGTSGAVEAGGKQYYVIRASWLVNNSHLSYIGDFFVSADGKKIYSGTALQGEYIMENVIWEE